MEHCNHPLDHIYPNNSLILLEALIPYVDPALRLPLALLIKIQEIQFILNTFSNPVAMKACGFDNTPANPQDMLLSICNSMGFNFTEQLNQFQTMQTMMQQMQTQNPAENSPANDFLRTMHAVGNENSNPLNAAFNINTNSDATTNTDDFSNSRDEMLDAIREILNEQSENKHNINI